MTPTDRPPVPPDLVRGTPADEVRGAATVARCRLGVWQLVWSDYCRHYATRTESARHRAWLFAPRMVTNACLHAGLLIRLVQGSHPALAWLWRRLLISMHSCDVSPASVIGPGLFMPHPVGIVIGPNVEIGEDAVLQHFVGLSPATTENWAPGRGVVRTLQIGDNVTIFPGAYVLGAITIGDGAIIGAQSMVIRDVPAGHATNARGLLRPLTDTEQATRMRGWAGAA